MSISAPGPPTDRSHLFVAYREDNSIVTARDIAKHGEPNEELYCPCCLTEKKKREPVEFDPDSIQFYHITSALRACWRDNRHNDRYHPEIMQAIYAMFSNRSEKKNPEIEYTDIKRCDYDVAAETPYRNDLEGVVVEVQHKCGNFTTRFYRKVRNAHRAGYGVHVVFSSESSGKQWFTQVMKDHIGTDAHIGQYCDGDLQLGTMIHPDRMHYNKFSDFD